MEQRKHFRGDPDYKSVFSVAVDELIDARIENRSERMSAIQALTDEYVASAGERPDGAELSRLEDYVLLEELTDPDPMKMKRQEYPFMSDWQLQRNWARELPLAYFEDKMDTYGRLHEFPQRRRRTKREQVWLDRQYLRDNRARNRKYKAFKDGKDCGVFTVSVETGELIVRNRRKCEEFYRIYR